VALAARHDVLNPDLLRHIAMISCTVWHCSVLRGIFRMDMKLLLSGNASAGSSDHYSLRAHFFAWVRYPWHSPPRSERDRLPCSSTNRTGSRSELFRLCLPCVFIPAGRCCRQKGDGHSGSRAEYDAATRPAGDRHRGPEANRAGREEVTLAHPGLHTGIFCRYGLVAAGQTPTLPRTCSIARSARVDLNRPGVYAPDDNAKC
jgi:hypothetical protein